MFQIGEILKTRGNNGEVLIALDSNYFYKQAFESLLMKSKKHERVLKVEKIVEIGDKLIIKFIGVDTISDAYKLIGYKAFLEGNKKDLTDKNSILRFEVYDLKGEMWGMVVNDVEGDFSRIIEVEDEGEIVFIPYSDTIIKEIHRAQKKIIIDPPEGLRDLNR